MRITVPAHVYRGLIDEHTTEAERRRYPDPGRQLADGRVEFDLDDETIAELQPFVLPGEAFADALERLLAIAGGRLS